MPDLMADPPRRRLTSEDKDRIIALARDGHDARTIAQQLNLHGQSVNGFMSSARKLGYIQTDPDKPVRQYIPPPMPSAPEALSMPMPETTPVSTIPPVASPATPPAPATVQIQVPSPAMHSVPASKAANAATQRQQDQQSAMNGFSGGRPVVADSGGFTTPSGEIRWTVERIQPPDGVLGTHYGPFSVEELGQNYGEGTYKVTRHDPGRQVAVEYIRKIGPTYGQTRNPKNYTGTQAGTVQRPFLQRSWGQQSQDASEGVPAQRPFYLRDSAFDLGARSGGNDSVAAEALRQMGQQNQRLIEREEKVRQSGPESTIMQFMQAQHDLMNKRWEEERQREEQRRESERERWEREQKAAREAHDRELQRLKYENEARLAEIKLQNEERERRQEAERKYFLDLEDRRLAIVRQEAEVQQRRLEGELSQTRDQMGRLQEATAQELQDSREATTKALERNKEELDQRFREREAQLEREYRLRERGLDKEHELNREMLNMQKQQIESSAGDQLVNLIQTTVKEASKGFERYTDLAKLQAMTPEAQAAAIQRGAVDGNVLGGPQAPGQQAQGQQGHGPQVPAQRVHAPAPPAQQPFEPSPARGAAVIEKPAGNGNGHGAPAPAAAPVAQAQEGTVGLTERMESLLRRGIDTAEGREMFLNIVSEWALHVSVGNNPSVFATVYLELLRDEKHSEVRQFSSLFFAVMSARAWPRMFTFLKPYLDQEMLGIFQKPEAEKFYEAFRAMIYNTVTNFWGDSMVSAQQGAPQAQAPQAQVPVAQVPQPEMAVPQESPVVPVPVAPVPVAPPQAAPTVAPPQQFQTVNPLPARAPVEPAGAGATAPAQVSQGIPLPTREALRPAS